jgi:hypothetical protein
MRFSCAPLERGGPTNKGSQHDLSINDEPAAQTAKGRTPKGSSVSCKRWLGGAMP